MSNIERCCNVRGGIETDYMRVSFVVILCSSSGNIFANSNLYENIIILRTEAIVSIE